MAAIANAIERAVGTRLTELPMSPRKVRAAIDAKSTWLKPSGALPKVRSTLRARVIGTSNAWAAIPRRRTLLQQPEEMQALHVANRDRLR
jgi:hypothetical protein